METQKDREARLMGIERQLESLYFVSPVIPMDSLKQELVSCENKKLKILEWRMKSTSIWLEVMD